MDKENIIHNQEPNSLIYRAYVPLHRENLSKLHTEKDGRKFRYVEGAVVLDRRDVQEKMGWTDQEVSDHYTTFFEINGFLTDVRKINYDFRHQGISTGAVGYRSWVVDDYEIEIDDKILLVRARMLSVKVYEDSMIRIKGRNGETIEDGNLLENIENGRVYTWSIEFKPVTQGTTKSGVTIYRTYHTPRISFLDVTQGIPDAGGFTLRNYLETNIINNNENKQLNSTLSLLRKFTNQKSMSIYKKGDELSRQIKCRVMSDFTEKDSKILYTVIIDEGEETEMDETELERMFGKPTAETTPKSTETKRSEENQRAWVNQTVKNKIGEFGLVTAKTSTVGADSIETSTYTIQKLNGEQVIVDKIGNNYQITEGNAEKEDFEWMTAEPGQIIFELMKKLTTAQTVRSNPENEKEKAELEAKLTEAESQLRIYKDKETATNSVQNLIKPTDSVNIHSSVDQNESANKPAEMSYEDLLRKYPTTTN